MKIELTSLQVKSQKAFKAFVDEEIVPFAEQFDQAERVPTQVIRKLANEGYLASIIPKENGGKGMDMITFGLLCQEFGRGSASLLSLLTVQAMVSSAILKWGSPSQKWYWLPRLATGESIAAFGLSESNVGSDAKSVETYSKLCDSGYLLNGEKKWISWGQLADLFLIIAQCEGKPTAFLVERKTPGFTIEPIQGMLGFKSAMLAKLYLHDCLI